MGEIWERYGRDMGEIWGEMGRYGCGLARGEQLVARDHLQLVRRRAQRLEHRRRLGLGRAVQHEEAAEGEAALRLAAREGARLRLLALQRLRAEREHAPGTRREQSEVSSAKN